MNDSGFFYQPKPEWNPNQLEIEFFWPLTEQIPLDLNYEGCAVKNNYVYSDVTTTNGQTLSMAIRDWSSATVTSQLHLDSDGITFTNFEMPWYRKILFKLMGFKWNN